MTLAADPEALRPADARAARRRDLTRQLAEVTRELLALERAEQRIPTIAEPTTLDLIPYDTLANRSARVRAWGAANGHTINPRGRLSKTLLDAYNTANPEDTP